MNIQSWIENNKSISTILSLIILSFIFDTLWAIIFISTIYLLDHTFNADAELYDDHIQKQTHSQHRTGTFQRPYTAGVYFSSPKKYSKNNNIVPHSQGTAMFFSDGKIAKRNDYKFGNKVAGQRKPSLMSLIHGRTPDNGKENYRPKIMQRQPLLAVVKNNMHLRRSSCLDSVPKSPLYRNMCSPVTGRKSESVFLSNVGSPSIYDQSYGYIEPYGINSPYYSPQLNNANLSINNGLEVHGSYFINKSLLHNDEKEVNSFSLVNDSFNSPAKSFFDDTFNGNHWRHSSSRKLNDIPDGTSTAEVMSVLKEKSKRKRPTPAQSTQECRSTKKIKFNDDVFDSTLNDLFPPVMTSGSPLRRKIATIRSAKKRYVSTASQSESPNEEESEAKKAKTVGSPSRSKFGLSEEQTDGMLDGSKEFTSSATTEVNDNLNDTPEQSSLVSAVKHVKNTLSGRYPDSASKKVSFNITATDERDDSIDGSANYSPSVKTSALRNLKSPFKKILRASFPSNLQPGSTEKRRKHPVYFTAKIDIDEIQSNREEYGARGASLKAFRLDQEEASKRVDDLFADDEDNGVDVNKTTVAGALQSTLNQVVPSSQPSNLLATLKNSSASSSISFGIPVSEKTDLFNGLASTASLNNLNSTSAASSGFSFPTIASVSTSQPVSTSSKSVSFSLNTTTTTIAAGDFNLKPDVNTVTTGFSFGAKSPAASDSIKTTSTTATVSGFSFGTTALPATNSIASAKTESTAPLFSFGIGASTSSTNLHSSSASVTAISQHTAVAGFAAPVMSSSANTATKPALNTFTFGAPQISNSGSTLPLSSGISFGINTDTQSNPPGVIKNLFGVSSNASSATLNLKSNTATVTSSTDIFPTSAQANNVFGGQFAISASSTTTTLTHPTVNSSSANLPNNSSGFAFAPTAAGFNFGSASAQNTFAASKPTLSSSSLPSFTISASQNSFQNVFGNSTTSTASTSQNIFPSVPTKNVFGPAATSSLFGASTKQSVFGTTTTSNGFGVTTTPSVFGSTATQGVFGSTTTSSIFIPATTTTNAFGTVTTPSVFGASSSQNVFGDATKGVFGSTATTNIFGATTTNVFEKASTTNVFGAPASTTNSTTNVFGAPASATNSHSAFGAPVKNNVFGAAPTANVFGNNNAGSVFGPKQQSNAFQFGSNSSSPAPTPSFGQQGTNAFGTAGSSSASMFGSSQNPTPFGNTNVASVFGGGSAAAPSNPFGQPAQQSSSGFDFSASLKPTIDFGAAPAKNSFGVQPMAPATVKPFGMSNPPSTPSFGAATPSFGTPQQPTFGTPHGNAFPTPNFNTPATGGAFAIGAAPANSGRVTQRARRRLRR